MANVTVQVEYLGVVRLLLKRKTDTFVFDEEPTVAVVVAAVGERHGEQAAEECRKQLFVLYRGGNGPGEVVEDQAVLADGSLLKVASLVTGG
ncbi:MAG: hypothetical protein P4N59_30860 [Negativicutes bacterium]|nr:hypothetical protein [Negativicutes bacterium]